LKVAYFGSLFLYLTYKIDITSKACYKQAVLKSTNIGS